MHAAPGDVHPPADPAVRLGRVGHAPSETHPSGSGAHTPHLLYTPILRTRAPPSAREGPQTRVSPLRTARWCPLPPPPIQSTEAGTVLTGLLQPVASPLFQELSGDTTSTLSEMNSAKLERNKAALTVTATTSSRTKGAAMITEAGAQAGRAKGNAEELQALRATL